MERLPRKKSVFREIQAGSSIGTCCLPYFSERRKINLGFRVHKKCISIFKIFRKNFENRLKVKVKMGAISASIFEPIFVSYRLKISV